MKIEEILFALLRSVICESKLKEQDLIQIQRSLDAEAYKKLYELSKAHDVAHLVGAGLQKEGLLCEEAEESKRFQQEQFMAVYRCENIKYELDLITSVLEDEKIDHIPLKGSVIREIYPHSWMRTSCDIDILVRESDIDCAVEAICRRLGYKTDGKREYHDISLFSSNGIHLELHFNIKETLDSIDKLLSRAWDYAVLKSGKAHKYSFTNEYLYFHILAHITYHFVSGGCGIRPFIDLWYINKNIPIDTALYENLLKQSGLLIFDRSCRHLCQVWFGGETNDEVSRSMQEYILFGGAYGNQYNRVASEQSQGRRQYIFSRIFVSYKDLVVRYPSLEGRKYLTPIYQVRRWGRLLSGDKIARSKRELEISKNISQDEVRKTKNLFLNIGLENIK